MKRSKRLEILVNLAKHREHDAAVSIAESRRKVNLEKEKLETLRAFLNDYKKRFDAKGKSSIQVRELSEYRSLLQRVNQLVQQQTVDWEKAEAKLTDLNNAWKLAYRHTVKMRNVMNTAVITETRIQEKREQNEMDDRAPRRYRQE